MKAHIRIASMIFNQPMMITPALLDLAAGWAQDRLNLNIVNVAVGAKLPGAEMDTVGDAFGGGEMVSPAERRRAVGAQTGVSMVPVHGALVSRSAHMQACEPMTSYEGLRAEIQAAVADPMIDHIVLDIDSGGGAATGAFELADYIAQAKLVKPITAIVNFQAFSAAYLIACACTDIVMSESSGVGSIGVIAKHADVSKRNEQQGVKVTSVFAGDKKNLMDPNAPLDDASLSFLQGMVNSNYDRFTSRVAANRGITQQAVKDTQAGVYFGADGVNAGLADSIEEPQAAVNRIAASVSAARADRQAKPAPRSVKAQAAAMNMAASL